MGGDGNPPIVVMTAADATTGAAETIGAAVMTAADATTVVGVTTGAGTSSAGRGRIAALEETEIAHGMTVVSETIAASRTNVVLETTAAAPVMTVGDLAVGAMAAVMVDPADLTGSGNPAGTGDAEYTGNRGM